MGAVTLLSSVPWGKIITYGPTIIETAGTLLESVKKRFGKKKDPQPSPEPVDISLSALAERISALEANEIRQAELISKMAEQLGSLSDALQVLSRRVALAVYLSLTAVVASLIAIIVMLSR